MNAPRILVIDDEAAMLENCDRLLRQAGWEVRTLGDPLQARAILTEFRPDVLLLDHRMPGADGMSVLAVARTEDAALPVILMTAYATVPAAVHAIREGAYDYLAKPFTADELTVTIARAARYRGLTLENQELRRQVAGAGVLAQVAGSSPAITRLLDTVRKVGPSDASVLITGESGTGKELLARCLHQLSPRRDRPFVPIDSAALPENLLESELFGHQRGAFTGAVAARSGLLVDADGGTVFFDEIGELTLALQAKLLRALEERQVRPVGGGALVPFNVRLITATNVDLEAAVAAGRFRADLYFRLHVVALRVPPLRERRGDVPALLQRFLARFAEVAGRPVPRITPEALEVLEGHAWPGNVRELRNLAERLMVLDEDGRITLADLPTPYRAGVAAPELPTAPSAELPAYEVARERALAEFQRTYLEQLLARHDGNISQAARAAGLSRRTLHRWLAGERAPAEPGIGEP